MYRSMRASVEKFDVAKDVCGPIDDDLLYGNAGNDAHETGRWPAQTRARIAAKSIRVVLNIEYKTTYSKMGVTARSHPRPTTAKP
jgi:hypothetical protein